MDYQQTLDYLFSRLPMFHRIGSAAYKADLKNTIAISELLGKPEKSFKSVHIAGTNGKGSTSHMLAAIMQKCGYKTGLYTSPHLKDFRERIRIDGKMIPENEVISFVENYKNDFEAIEPSFFEWTVGLAFHYFAKEKVDIAIIETGLGGRLDSTNLVQPDVSVITNISFDHMNLLGDTLEKIAGEKAGIIKSITPVIVGERQNECDFVFTNKAKELNAPITFASDHTTVKRISNSLTSQIFEINHDNEKALHVELDLPGIYQVKNIATVFQTVIELRKLGWNISAENFCSALQSVRETTGLNGRWQKLQEHPLVICDVGHNKAGIENILSQIKQHKYKTLRMVIGMVNDKDISTILKMLPKEAVYYFCKANIPRALDQKELKNFANNVGLMGEEYDSVQSALKNAVSDAGADDFIFVGGSTFVVAEVV